MCIYWIGFKLPFYTVSIQSLYSIEFSPRFIIIRLRNWTTIHTPFFGQSAITTERLPVLWIIYEECAMSAPNAKLKLDTLPDCVLHFCRRDVGVLHPRTRRGLRRVVDRARIRAAGQCFPTCASSRTGFTSGPSEAYLVGGLWESSTKKHVGCILTSRAWNRETLLVPTRRRTHTYTRPDTSRKWLCMSFRNVCFVSRRVRLR